MRVSLSPDQLRELYEDGGPKPELLEITPTGLLLCDVPLEVKLLTWQASE
jgi:hypothetical protein